MLVIVFIIFIIVTLVLKVKLHENEKCYFSTHLFSFSHLFYVTKNVFFNGFMVLVLVNDNNPVSCTLFGFIYYVKSMI